MRPIVLKDITWEINLNGTWLKNRVLKLHPETNGQIITGNRILKEGSSVYNLYMVEYAGLDPENGQALYWALDENGNEYKTTNFDDASNTNKKETGNTYPTFFGGFGTTLQAYGFDLSAQFGFQLGGRIYDSGYAKLMHSGLVSNMGTNWHVDALNAWTPENRNTDIPVLNTQGAYDFGGNESTYFLTSSNYLSLNNVTLGYTIPSRLTKKLGIETIRVYCSGDNLALWAKRKGLDPRLTWTSSSQGTYSLIRNISGGLRVVF